MRIGGREEGRVSQGSRAENLGDLDDVAGGLFVQ